MIESYSACRAAFGDSVGPMSDEKRVCADVALKCVMRRMPSSSYGANFQSGYSGDKLKRLVYRETLADVRESYGFGPLAWLFHPVMLALITEVVKLVVSWLWRRDDLDMQAIQGEMDE